MSGDLRSSAFGLRPDEEGRVKGKYREIFRAEDGREKKCYICVPRAVVVYSHWDQGKSFYCVGKNNFCPYCLRGGKDDKPRMRAYLGAIESEKYHQVLAEVPEFAFKSNVMISDPTIDLRNVTLFLKRKGPKMDGRVVTRCSRDFIAPTLRSAIRPFDVVEALDKFFIMPKLDGVENISVDPSAPVWAQIVPEPQE